MSRVDRWRARIGYGWSIGRRAGTWRLLGMALRGLLEPLIAWRTYDFYARDLTAPVAPYQATIPLDIRVATDADFERFRPTLLREGATWDEVEACRRAGDQCFIAVSGDRLVHFSWLVRRPVWLPEVGARLRLAPDEAYGRFSYTEPAWRGHGAHPAVVNFFTCWEQAAGIRSHYSFVMRHNLPARKLMVGRRPGVASELIRTVRT
ncbi:MAG: hypothetical protein ACREGL_10015, partial [Alphaproteobacteria bacterium]